MNEETIFAAVLDLNPEDRAGFLDGVCGENAELRRRIEGLLKSHKQAGADFLDPTQLPPPSTGEYRQFIETAGSTIGPYKLLEQIGEGGFGVVYAAEQTEPVKRRVALKIIKPGMDTAEVVARFESERQALAIMDHPHIAKVLDGGATESGRPYFVLELVKGIPITDYCDEYRLSPRERLELFAAVCEAVQHAHQKGIIHRDIKPSNVLVGLQGGRPTPKVIDFGVAKATNQRLTEKMIFTRQGQMVGTVQYMSPEQATMTGLDVDTRSDIYSLGNLLYELLTGTTPLDKEWIRRAGYAEIQRVVREEEPSRPSTRISESGDRLPSIAACRKVEPGRLGRIVRGDLDWIVMKALEKDRTRRYETASGFADDVRRYLNGEAVVAAPPRLSYRLNKFLRRNKGPVAAAGLLLLAMLAGIIGTTLGLVRAEQQRTRAEHQRRLAEKARDRTREVLDAMTSTVTGDSLSTQKEISPEQKKFLTMVLSYYEELAAEQADDEQSRAQRAAAAHRVGLIKYRLGRYAESAAALRLAVAVEKNLAADFPAVADHRANLARYYYNLALALQRGRPPEAEKQYRNGLAVAQRLAADFPAVPAHRRLASRIHNNLGVLLVDRGRRREAESQYQQALRILGRLAADFPGVPEDRDRRARLHYNLGSLLRDLGERPEAEAQYRHALALREMLATDFPTDPRYRWGLSHSHMSLGVVLEDQGKTSEAEQHDRKALSILEKLAADFPTVPKYRHVLAGSHNNLGRVLRGWRKTSEAVEHFRKALGIRAKLAADVPDAPDYRMELAKQHRNLGLMLLDLGQRSEAQEQARKALAIHEKLAADVPAVPAYREQLARSHFTLGFVLQATGNRPVAEAWYRKALAISRKLAADFPAVPVYRQLAAKVLKNLSLLSPQRPPPSSEPPSWTKAAFAAVRQHPASTTWHEPSEPWSKAATAYCGLVQRNPESPHHWMLAAIFLAQAGEKEKHSSLCGRMLKRFQSTSEPLVADKVAKACLLLPNAIDDRAALGQLVERAASGAGPAWALVYFRTLKALADFRAGRFRETVARLEKNRRATRSRPYLDALNLSILAMAYQKTGQFTKARNALDEVDRTMRRAIGGVRNDAKLPPGWPDLLITDIIRREARTLIAKRARRKPKNQ